MKKIHVVLLLSLTFVLSACFTSNTFVSGKMLMNVQQGMTPNEVRAIFGNEPDFRRFDGGMEEWEYRRYSSSFGGWSIILVHFVDGRVSGLDSFEDRNTNLNAISVSSPSPTAVTTIVGSPDRSPVPQRLGIMLEKDFDDFLSKLKFTIGTDEQKNLIIHAMQLHDFTSAQARLMINQLFMSDEKVDMMIRIYPYVVDKRNFNQVIDLLSFSGDKDKVRRSIGTYNNN